MPSAALSRAAHRVMSWTSFRLTRRRCSSPPPPALPQPAQGLLVGPPRACRAKASEARSGRCRPLRGVVVTAFAEWHLSRASVVLARRGLKWPYREQG